MKSISNYSKTSTTTRDSLSRVIKKETGIKMKDASAMIDDILSIIREAVLNHKHVKIRMFGCFTSKHKGSRVGRNPKTMVESIISPRSVVKFKIAPTLKKRINSSIGNFTLVK
jgi:integration host factor subunit alpha